MRAGWVVVHRLLGLATAAFLFVAGITGALIAWDRELDAWLNPAFYVAESGHGGLTSPAAALSVARQVEAADPRLRVSYLPLAAAPGRTMQLNVDARIDPASGRPHDLGFDQIAVDPATGRVQARRMWGSLSWDAGSLMPFLYKLHYSLHLPLLAGVDMGAWVMGIVALAWMVDSLIALGLSFPNRRAWRRSFAFRWGRGGHALTFDLHRSGGVWLWPLLLTLAVTALGLSLKQELVQPVVSWVSPVTDSPFDLRRPAITEAEASAMREQVLALALAEAARRAWSEPPGGLFEHPALALGGVGFYAAEQDRGHVGLGPRWLYFDLASGRPAGALVPGQGSAGDLYLQSQYPLHSGRVGGVAGRALVSLLGVMVAMLSITGVMLWHRKAKSRGERGERRSVQAA